MMKCWRTLEHTWKSDYGKDLTGTCLDKVPLKKVF